ncbi:MAG: DNA repair protein RecN, partial [Chloroflexi bacterium]|nr:DNA repair protein RecN [Chloroflexota bacterium]
DERGIDRVEFAVSTNPGEPARPLAKIASGGEISRLMLALKLVLSGSGPVPTLIFDEIDSGIGGSVANAVGEKLATVGRKHQVLIVTHLAQIARFAGAHFEIAKSARGDRTHSTVEVLDIQGRVREIARMLSGDVGMEAALKHAEELLAGAQPSIVGSEA